MNYLVVLFKNKKRKKIIKSFLTKNKAELFFKYESKKSHDVDFEVVFENASKVVYEIALLSKIKDEQLSIFKQDDLGRNIKIDLEDSEYKIIGIERYCLPEKIYDWSKNCRISFNELTNNYFSGTTIQSVFSINNKVVIQEDERFKLFSLKNSEESKRLLEVLEDHFYSKGKTNFIFVKDLDTTHRKYLYKLLEDNGFDKNKLYRQSTTFSKK